MAKGYLFASTQNSNREDEIIFAGANCHVKYPPDSRLDITGRFLEAWHRLERREGSRVKLNRFAELLAPALAGRVVPASTIGRWEKGSVPDLGAVAAIATLCGVHPAWLAFGLGSPDDAVVGEVFVKPAGKAKPSPETRLNRKSMPAPRSDDLPAVANARRSKGGSK